jgi:hypothetical protein
MPTELVYPTPPPLRVNHPAKSLTGAERRRPRIKNDRSPSCPMPCLAGFSPPPVVAIMPSWRYVPAPPAQGGAGGLLGAPRRLLRDSEIATIPFWRERHAANRKKRGMSILKYVNDERRSGWWHAAPPQRAAGLSPVFSVTQSLHIIQYAPHSFLENRQNTRRQKRYSGKFRVPKGREGLPASSWRWTGKAGTPSGAARP